jgi:threonine dehydratase
VTCCSTGNHGRGVAFAAARARGLRAVVCMSSLVPQAKVDGIRALGAEVRIVGRSQDEALAESRRLAARKTAWSRSRPSTIRWSSPARARSGSSFWRTGRTSRRSSCRCRAGGLAAGVALAAKAIKPSIRVIGITMDRGAAMYESLRAGRRSR